MEKTYLATGGAGFIGSHLVERLAADGGRVIVVDDLSTGKKQNISKDIKLYRESILGNIGDLFKGVDVVFHLAALTRPQWSIDHPVESNRVNVEGTLKVLNHCRNHGVGRIVFASSSSLYGTPTLYPTTENEVPKPVSPYGLQKLIGEQYCQLYERMYGMKINCIRPFNVYGPRQNFKSGYSAAVPAFINDKQPYITGDGEQLRDFVYVSDVVDLFVKASEGKVTGESFNAGAGKNITINYLYKKIKKLKGSKVDARHVEAVLEPRITLSDCKKAYKMLGWSPKVGLTEGLRRTINGN